MSVVSRQQHHNVDTFHAKRWDRTVRDLQTHSTPIGGIEPFVFNL